MKKNKNRIMAYSLLMMGAVLIAMGLSYSFFSLKGTGYKESSIGAGSMTFHYKEYEDSISLGNAMPMTDAQGMAQTDYFDFEITGSTSQEIATLYYINVERTSASYDGLDPHIRLYLTKVDNDGVETPVSVIGSSNGRSGSLFSELGQYYANTYNEYDGEAELGFKESEHLLYADKINQNTANYKQKYRLRMWMDIDTEMLVQRNGIDTYPYNGKTYEIKVNVYSEGMNITTPTLASTCENCVYPTETDGDLPFVMTSSDYVTDYHDIIDNNGQDVFLAVTLNTDNRIKYMYICSLVDDRPFCTKMSTSTTDTIKIYREELKTLQQPSLFGDNCTHTAYGIECDDDKLSVTVDQYGDRIIYDKTKNYYCRVYYDGFVTCESE